MSAWKVVLRTVRIYGPIGASEIARRCPELEPASIGRCLQALAHEQAITFHFTFTSRTGLVADGWDCTIYGRQRFNELFGKEVRRERAAENRGSVPVAEGRGEHPDR